MGNTPPCSQNPPPELVNNCYAGTITPSTNIPHGCIADLPGKSKQLNTVCESIGNFNGEWTGGSFSSNTCFACNIEGVAIELNQPLCKLNSKQECFNAAGNRFTCNRKLFTGDPVECCIKDLDCENIDPNVDTVPANCYSDINKTRTCSYPTYNNPNVANHRFLASSDCKDTMYEYCTGTRDYDDPNSQQWLSRWLDKTAKTVSGGLISPCEKALIRNIFTIQEGSNYCPNIDQILLTHSECNLPLIYPVNSSGYYWAQRLIKAVIEKYLAQGNTIGALPGTKNYNEFQNYLKSLCCKFPSLCQDGLLSACSSNTPYRMSLNPVLTDFCGCHLPPEEYQHYTDNYNIPKECTPICNRSSAIPITGNDGSPILCDRTVCLVENTTVNLINAQSNGTIDFTQICGTCPSGSCTCIISDTTIDIANSTIQGTVVPALQECGNFNCTQKNPGILGPEVITIPCDVSQGNPNAAIEASNLFQQQKASNLSFFWTLLVIGLGFFIVFIVILLFYKNT